MVETYLIGKHDDLQEKYHIPDIDVHLWSLYNVKSTIQGDTNADELKKEK